MKAQLDQIVSAVRDVLGPDVVGAYLFGSATLGGLRPYIDVLVVSKRPTTGAEKQRPSSGTSTRARSRPCDLPRRGGEDRWDDLASRLRPHADYVVAEIERIT